MSIQSKYLPEAYLLDDRDIRPRADNPNGRIVHNAWSYEQKNAVGTVDFSTGTNCDEVEDTPYLHDSQTWRNDFFA